MHANYQCRVVVILSVACVWTRLIGHLTLPPSAPLPPSLPTAQGDQGHPRLPPEGPKVRTACRKHGEGRMRVEGQGLWVWHRYGPVTGNWRGRLLRGGRGYCRLRIMQSSSLLGNLLSQSSSSLHLPKSFIHASFLHPFVLPTLHRKDAKSVKVKKSSTGTKFKIRCSRVRTLIGTLVHVPIFFLACVCLIHCMWYMYVCCVSACLDLVRGGGCVEDREERAERKQTGKLYAYDRRYTHIFAHYPTLLLPKTVLVHALGL